MFGQKMVAYFFYNKYYSCIYMKILESCFEIKRLISNVSLCSVIVYYSFFLALKDCQCTKPALYFVGFFLLVCL